MRRWTPLSPAFLSCSSEKVRPTKGGNGDALWDGCAKPIPSHLSPRRRGRRARGEWVRDAQWARHTQRVAGQEGARRRWGGHVGVEAKRDWQPHHKRQYRRCSG